MYMYMCTVYMYIMHIEIQYMYTCTCTCTDDLLMSDAPSTTSGGTAVPGREAMEGKGGNLLLQLCLLVCGVVLSECRMCSLWEVAEWVGQDCLFAKSHCSKMGIHLHCCMT